jgi:CRISPR-associated protein Cas1
MQDVASLHQPFAKITEIEESSLLDEDEITQEQKNIWNREMAAIYLIEQGTSIYKDYQRFIVHVSEKPKLEILIREVQQILVFGNIQLSTPVLQACLQEQIPVLFLSQNGRYHGHLWSEESTNLDNQLTQISRRNDDYFQFSVSKAVVLGKLMNSKYLISKKTYIFVKY